MKPKLLLRIAAILILIHGLLHTIGFTQWKQDPDRHEVIKQMTGQKLPFMGASRNIGDYYEGFGYACSIALILIALLLWIVSGELSSHPSLAKKVIVVISFGLLVWAVDELIYFFPLATGLTFVASLCGFGSLAGLSKQSAYK